VPKNQLYTIVFISVFGRFIVDERAVCEFLDEKLAFNLVSVSEKILWEILSIVWTKPQVTFFIYATSITNFNMVTVTCLTL